MIHNKKAFFHPADENPNLQRCIDKMTVEMIAHDIGVKRIKDKYPKLVSK